MGGRGVTLSEGALGGGPRIGLGAGPGDTAASYCESCPPLRKQVRSVWRDTLRYKKTSNKSKVRT